MPEIKTRDTVKGSIRTLERAAVVGERMKKAYVRTKEQARHSAYSADGSPEEYAADRLSDGTEAIACEAAHQFEKQGSRGVRATREKLSAMGAHFEKREDDTGLHDTAEVKNEAGIGRNMAGTEPDKPNADQRKADLAKKKAREKAAESIRRQSADSASWPIRATNLELPVDKRVLHGAKTIKQTEKSAGKATVKTTQKAIKTTQRSIKTTEQTVRSVIKDSQAAAKAGQGSVQVARAGAKASNKSIKAAAKATASAIKAMIAATKALVAAIAAGGWITVTVCVIISLSGLVVGSCFGIFFSGEDSGTGQTVSTAVREINEDYEARLDAIKENIPYDTLEMSGSRAVWPEVLSVYAVRTTTDPNNAMDVATVDDSRKAILKDIFWQMNEISYRTESKTDIVITETDDGNGSIEETITTITRTTLYIMVSHKTAAEMADLLNFTAEQQEQLAELLADENNSLWAAVLYGIGVSDDAIVAVALSQVGNIGGQPYWSWYGFSSRVEWCACFVSWCANECGYIDNGVVPKFAGCVNGVQWFKDRGQWADNSIEPTPGMIIFYDWNSLNGTSGPQDGQADHVGIVEKCENGIIYTVEGNSGDSCRQRQYPVGHYEILGYGVPAY